MSFNKYASCYRSVDEALQLDYKQSSNVAFIHYLKSISAITDTLIEDAGQRVFPSEQNVQVKQLLTVAKNCLDRAEKLGQILADECNDESKHLVDNEIKKLSSVEKNNEFSSTLLPDIKKPADSNLSTILDLSVISFDTMPSANIEIFMPKPIKISPIEQVERENQQLMAAYKARLARTHTVGARVNLQLTLERRLAENVTLARAKEQVVKYREQENQKRLLEQAARKIGNIHLMSAKEEETTKHVYAKILQYEQEMQWPLAMKDKLKINPLDFSHIDVIIRQTLSVPDHPISQFMQKLQYTIYDKVIHLISRCPNNLDNCTNHVENDNNITINHDTNINQRRISQIFRERSESIMEGTLPTDLQMEETAKNSITQFSEVLKDTVDNSESSERKEITSEKLEQLEEDALQRHIHYIVNDVRYSLDKVLNMLVLTYEQLNSPEGRDQCYASMEEPFFKPLWPYLIRLFRLAYKSEELNTAQVMTRYANTSLQDLKVSQNFWASDSTKPYEDAIEEIKTIINFCCPLKKLDALVRVAHRVCQEHNESGKTIGADDLIPILSFVVLRTRLPQLVSECHAMEQFIHEGYLMGEEGYCLTTVQTVFQYLKSLLADA